MLTEQEFAEWYARVNMRLDGGSGAIASATKRIGELEATVKLLSANSDRHNSLLQSHEEAFRRMGSHAIRLSNLEECLGLDPDDGEAGTKLNELERLFASADDKADRALGSAQQMHNLLLQLQQRVRAISFKVGVPVVETDAKPEAVAFTEIDAGEKPFPVTSNPEEYWQAKLAEMTESRDRERRWKTEADRIADTLRVSVEESAKALMIERNAVNELTAQRSRLEAELELCRASLKGANENAARLLVERDSAKRLSEEILGDSRNGIEQLRETTEMVVALRAERDMARGEVAALKEERHILQGKLEAAEEAKNFAQSEATRIAAHNLALEAERNAHMKQENKDGN